MKMPSRIAALVVAGLAIFARPLFSQVPASSAIPKGSDQVAIHSTGMLELSEEAAANLKLPRRVSFEVQVESKGEPIASAIGRSRAKGLYKLTVSDPETKSI